jgi:hypothetical protein
MSLRSAGLKSITLADARSNLVTLEFPSNWKSCCQNVSVQVPSEITEFFQKYRDTFPGNGYFFTNFIEALPYSW